MNFHRDRALIPAEHSWLQELKEKMQELISRDEPIVKHNLNLQEAIDFFREIGRRIRRGFCVTAEVPG